MMRYADMWRPVYELWATAAWFTAAAAMALGQVPYGWIAAAACTVFGAWRARQALHLFRFRIGISGQRLLTVTADQMSGQTDEALGRQHGLWMGRGFVWGQVQAQLASEIAKLNPEEVRALPQWLPGWLRARLVPRGTIPDTHAIGSSWIHGLGEEVDQYLPIPALAGHTLIVGTTRSGKTRLYEMLTYQVIHSGAVLIIFDPKGDKDWKRRVESECRRAGRDFLYFHPAFPSQSVRLNPVKNWNMPSEIASRIAQLLPSESGGDAFTQFAWLTIDRVVNGMLMIGERPDLKRIKRHIEGGVEGLLEACFFTYFTPIYGTDWDSRIAHLVQKAPSRVHAMAAFYREDQVAKGRRNETLDGLISTLTHDKEHFGKMILSLLPLLQMLCSGEIGEMLSPDMANFDDPRVPYDLERVIAGRKVLYVGLDSLSNKAVGSAIGSVLLADLAAVAGATYNFGEPQDVYVFMDEAAEIINDQAIQILNKAGGAGFKAFLATQTIADFEARLGKKPKALQTLGNTNNLIALRIRDFDTAEWVSEMMGETVAKSIEVSHNVGSDTESTVLEFKGQVSRKLKETKVAMVSPEILLRLPNLQYIAMIAGGRIVKGRLPLIQG